MTTLCHSCRKKSVHVFRALFFIVLLLGAVTACTMIRPQNLVRIARGVDMQLQAPANDGTVLQKVDAAYRGERHTLLMQVQTHNGVLDMAGLTPTGTRLFSLSFDGTTITSWKSPLFSAPFDGAYVLADYQLCALPVTSLQRALPGNLQIRENLKMNGDKTRLVLDSDSHVLIEVLYRKDGSLQYCHRERDYCLDITALP
jgi:hypothetical protein